MRRQFESLSGTVKTLFAPDAVPSQAVRLRARARACMRLRAEGCGEAG